jgi:adenine-specific DNA-methyltransferase
MMEHIIRASTRQGAVVLDCFMGTGATGKAAKKLHRQFIGIEKDAGYFRQAEARIHAEGTQARQMELIGA